MKTRSDWSWELRTNFLRLWIASCACSYSSFVTIASCAFFADIPFFFGNAPLVFVTDESAFAAMCPLWLLGRRLSGHGFMLGGCWNALRIQSLCNLCARLATNHFHVKIRRTIGGFNVDDKVMLVSRIGFVPVWDWCNFTNFALFPVSFPLQT